MDILKFFEINPRKIPIAVDLGTNQIKLAVFQGIDNDGTLHLSDYLITPSLSDFAVSTYIESPIIDPMAVEEQIRSAIQPLGLSYPPIFALLPDHAALTALISVPFDAPAENFSNLVREELAPILQVAPESWLFYGTPIGNDEGQKLLLGVAILKQNLLEVGAILQKGGLNPTVMDLSTLNLLNLLERYLKLPENSGKNIAVVNLGNETTSVAVFQDGNLKIFNNKSIGGFDFSKQISEHFHVSERDAENFKRNEMFFLSEFVAEQDELYNYNVIRGVFGELVKEIFGTLEQFLIKSREFTVNEVILAGGGANFSNIHVVLEGNLNTRVFPISSLLSIKKNNIELSPQEKNILAPCCGAFYRYGN